MIRLINTIFDDDYSASQKAEFVAYFIKNFCKRVSDNNKVIVDISYSSIVTEREILSAIIKVAKEKATFILEQDLRKLSENMERVLLYVICNFISCIYENFFIFRYLEGLMIKIYKR